MANSGTNGTFPHGRPQLVDAYGRPFDRDDGNGRPAGIALPNWLTFISNVESGDHAYLHGRYDEALRYGRADAEVMRRDAYLMSLLQERQLAVSGLNWHLEVPDEKDPFQARVRDGVARIVGGIPGLRRIIHWLTEAVWYGRYGVQLSWKHATFMDRPGKRDTKSQAAIAAAMQGGQGTPPEEDRPRGTPRPCLTVRKAWPVHGDKIGYQHDHVPYVLVNPGEANSLPGAKLITTTIGGTGLSLRGTWRERFLIHQHLMEDADFFDSEQADSVHGVGIRSKLFWLNWLKLEWLSNVTDFFDKVGLGMTVWKYPAGNDAAKQEALAAARAQSSRSHVLVPVWGGEGKEALTGVDRIEVPTAGSEGLVRLIEYLDGQIERYVIGQSGSSRPGASGIGNEAASEMMAGTKEQIVKHDAAMLAVTLTGDHDSPGLVSVIQKHTFPEADFPVRWVFDVERTKSEGTLNSVRSLIEMGLDVKADEVRSAAGPSKPAEGDEVVKAQVPGAMQPGAGGIPGPGAGAAPGAPPEQGAAQQQQPPLEAPQGEPGDFMQALQQARQGEVLRYDWQNMGMVKVSPGGLPLYRWYDPARRQARVQNVPPGGRRKAPRAIARGAGPGRTPPAALDAGERTLRVLARLCKLMFPGGWVKPSGLPALVGAKGGEHVTPWPRREPDGTCVIELHPESGGHWELALLPDGGLAMHAPSEPERGALEALAVAGVDSVTGKAVPQEGLPGYVRSGNRKRRTFRQAKAPELMAKADSVLPRPEPEPAPPTPEGRLGAVLRHLRESGSAEMAQRVALAYARRPT